MKTSGDSWPTHKRGLTGTIVGGPVGGHKENVLVQMDHAKSQESFTLKSKGLNKFEFICDKYYFPKNMKIDVPKVVTNNISKYNVSVEHVEDAEVVRLTVKGDKVWHHSVLGDKHRLMFCTSDNVNMVGLGLRVHQDITRILVSVCQMYEGQVKQYIAIFTQTFESVPKKQTTSVLRFNRPLTLNCDQIYMIVLHVYGGASDVGEDGEEFVAVHTKEKQILFKFDEFPQRDGNDKTNVEIGLIEKLYINV